MNEIVDEEVFAETMTMEGTDIVGDAEGRGDAP